MTPNAKDFALQLVHRAAILLAASVIIGAFGAHGLKEVIAPHRDVFQTGVFYQFIHSIGVFLVALGCGAELIPPKLAKQVSSLFLLGVILFSGSLYALAISSITAFGAITPLGGIAFIVGWLLLGFRVGKAAT